MDILQSLLRTDKKCSILLVIVIVRARMIYGSIAIDYTLQVPEWDLSKWKRERGSDSQVKELTKLLKHYINTVQKDY